MNKKADLVSNYFASIYLTFISLLQGIALSQLVPQMFTYFKIAEHPWTDIHVLPLTIMLLIIFIVWHHYAISIFFLRWFPNIIDTIIPFIVGIGQFVLISYLVINNSLSDMNIEAWTKGFAIFFIVGSVAYFAAAWRNEADLFTNIMSMENAILHSYNIRKHYNLGGISILIQGLFGILIIFMQNLQLLWFSLLFFVMHIVISEYFLLKIIRPQFEKGMDELK